MVIYLSLLVAIVGAAFFVLSSNTRVQDLAKIAYAAGLLAFLMRIAELPSIKSG